MAKTAQGLLCIEPISEVEKMIGSIDIPFPQVGPQITGTQMEIESAEKKMDFNLSRLVSGLMITEDCRLSLRERMERE